MSSLNMREKRVLEDFLGMGGGYVLNFSDRIFAETDDLHRVTAMVDELFTLLEKADRI